MDKVLNMLAPILLFVTVIVGYIWVTLSAHRVSPAWSIRGLTLFPIMPIAFAVTHPGAVWKPALMFILAVLLLTPYLPAAPGPDRISLFGGETGFRSAPAADPASELEVEQGREPEKPFYQFEAPTTPPPAHSTAGHRELDEYQKRVRELEAERLKKSEQTAEHYYNSADNADRHMNGSTLRSKQGQ